jgi:BirA family biotin operon repressor/biotin-[acetyl-CoA-carboxylase] ligase
MHERTLKKSLSDLPLGQIRFFESVGSTNDEALAWATGGAPDLSVVITDEQTRGRGRLDRKWFTPKGTALAFSLILRPSGALRPHLSRIVGLAALSIVDSLQKQGLSAQIKWPNDVLLNERKIAGILVETVWSGELIDSMVVGMGINVMKEAVPPFHLLRFPATSVEEAVGKAPDRKRLLHDILAAFVRRLPQLGSEDLIKEWEEKLAFRGEQVQIVNELDRDTKEATMNTLTGELLGLEADGSLRLRSEYGNPVTVHFGDISLRPSADTI